MRRYSFCIQSALLLAVILLIQTGCKRNEPASSYTFNYDTSLLVKGLPIPSLPQLRWQNYERIMFVHFNPTTWTGREYDDLTFPISRMNPSLLNTDQWCEVAKSWDAKMILFVAKHTGGFCWWQTETSDYGVRNIPWRNGKGDVLRDLSRSCSKYGLDLGVYVYPGDEKWGAGIGSGGRTKDPAKQEEYNLVFRKQLTEVLTKYGPIKEVWFDGSCIIDVSDILEEHAKDAVIFQGPKATIRWVGNEDGVAPYPNWYTLKREDLETGVSTALASDPDGDAYAPVEIDLPLLKNKGHKWFWAPNTDSMILTPDQLVEVYYRTAGRGGIMLLNSTPDTTGLIPESHVKVYSEFGNIIRERFSSPLGSVSGIGDTVELKLDQPTNINHIVLQEEVAYGQRVRSYAVEGFDNGKWFLICSGTSIGTKKIDAFDSVLVSSIRFIASKSVAAPIIKDLSAYNIKNYSTVGKSIISKPIMVGSWSSNTYDAEWTKLEIDLTPYIESIGQYELNFQLVSYDWNKDWGLEFKNWEVEMYRKKLPQAIQKVDNGWRFIITRSQQTDRAAQFPTKFSVDVRSKPGKTVGVIELRKLVY